MFLILTMDPLFCHLGKRIPNLSLMIVLSEASRLGGSSHPIAQFQVVYPLEQLTHFLRKWHFGPQNLVDWKLENLLSFKKSLVKWGWKNCHAKKHSFLTSWEIFFTGTWSLKRNVCLLFSLLSFPEEKETFLLSL